MFEAYDALSIRRIDLEVASSRASPPSDDSRIALETQLRQCLVARYGSIPPIDTNDASCIANTENASTAGSSSLVSSSPTYEFPLFRSAASNLQRIHLPPELDDQSNTGKFIVPSRCANYYFTTRADGERRARFLLTAVDGDEVRRWSRQRAWALEVPWKVCIVRGNRLPRVAPPAVVPSDPTSKMKRTKVGKKRRIALRIRQRAHEAASLVEQEALLRKVEADKAKRVRRNRERKLKRRQKEKKEKGNANTGPDDVDALSATSLVV
ncbi:hypothetical protein K3495_g5220 [Podosphaera aphanis]|nr:hypothetical protein K3495_g5220 [Podosphaera aphanis]